MDEIANSDERLVVDSLAITSIITCYAQNHQSKDGSSELIPVKIISSDLLNAHLIDS